MNDQSTAHRETLLQELARDTHKAASGDMKAPEQHSPSDFAPEPALARLNELGTQLWLDTGDLDEAHKRWKSELSALTTNNTLVNQVVQGGAMDEVIHEAARRIRESEPDLPEADLVLDIGFVVNCRVAQRLVEAFDVPVSVELHPAVAQDMDKTLDYARRYYAVNPDRFIIKIPLTPAGYCAVARLSREGIPVNFTLGFSARQNYLAAHVANPAYVNVFLGRLNAVVSENHLGDGNYVGEKTALASQAAVRQARDSSTGITTRQIAASLRSGEQLAALAGLDVFTIPPKALDEFLASRPDPASLKSHLDDELEVTLSDDADKTSLDILWTVNEAFQTLTQELKDKGTNIVADDIIQADKRHGTQLFGGFDEAEQEEIRTKGKIPDVARWKGRAALDDLMTESAMQSFGKDQKALDDHILRLALQP